MFFLLSGPNPDHKTWDLCAAAREGKVQLERVCGIAARPGESQVNADVAWP